MSLRLEGRARAGFVAACGLVLALLTASPGGTQVVHPADPEQIFRAARKAWSFTAYPRYATYTIVSKFSYADTSVERHYDAIADMRRDIVFARTFSREEIANPSMPHGFDFRVGSLNGQGGAKVGSDSNADRIGPLALSVNYDFGISLLPQKTTVVSSGHDIQFPPNLPIIGTTSTVTHDYVVRLIDMRDDGATYHLGLEPTHDAGRLRLREMWVNAQTYLTKRILIAGNFTAEPYTTVPWLVDFVHIGGADYIAQETAEAPLEFDDNVTLPNVTIAFENLKLLSELPQYGAVGANDSSTALSEP